jgi:hypothetical protein
MYFICSSRRGWPNTRKNIRWSKLLLYGIAGAATFLVVLTTPGILNILNPIARRAPILMEFDDSPLGPSSVRRESHARTSAVFNAPSTCHSISLNAQQPSRRVGPRTNARLPCSWLGVRLSISIRGRSAVWREAPHYSHPFARKIDEQRRGDADLDQMIDNRLLKTPIQS